MMLSLRLSCRWQRLSCGWGVVVSSFVVIRGLGRSDCFEKKSVGMGFVVVVIVVFRKSLLRC